MLKFRETLLTASLALVATIAAAAPFTQGRLTTIAAYPECGDSTALSADQAALNQSKDGLVQDGDHQLLSAASDDTIEEYLSFHAQVTEENGKFSLMPWSGLRTHAN